MSVAIATRPVRFLAWRLWLCVALATPAALTTPAVAQETDAGTRQYAAAVALHNRQLYDLAADEWLKFVKSYPKHPKIARGRHYLGICYYQTGKLDEAQTTFSNVIKTYPKFELLETAYLYLGVSQFTAAQEGKTQAYPLAAATFATLATKFPKGKYAAQALYYQGECLYAQDKKAEAVGMYERLASRFPNDALVPDALYGLGVAQQELEKPEAAGEAYSRFLKKFAKHALANEVGMRYGETLLARKQYSAAEKQLATAAALKDFAYAGHATMAYASCLSARGKYAEAASVYASVPAKFPKSPSAAQARLEGGKCAYLAAQYPAARKSLASVLAAAGDLGAEASHWTARCFLKEQQPALALQVADKAIAAYATGGFHAALLKDRADALYDLPNRRKESVAAYAALAAKYPQLPTAQDALYMAGFAALNVGDYQTALSHAEAFLKAHAKSRLSADVTYVAAESRLQLKQYDQASALYRRLLAENPQHAAADDWKLRLGVSLHVQEKYAETVAALKPFLASLRQPQAKAEAYYLSGSSQSQLKNYRDAIRELEASVKASDGWRQADETLIVLGHAYQGSGDSASAKARLQTLIGKYPKSAILDRAHFQLGEYAYEAKEYKTAAAHYQRVLDGWPKSTLVPAVLSGLGWAQLSVGDASAADATFTGLIDQHAKSDQAARARYPRGRARLQQKQFATAAEDIRAYLAGKPSDADRSDARYVLGLALAGLDKPSEAAAEFQAILKDDPKYAAGDRVQYELAWALKSQGKETEAAAAFGKLASAYPASSLAADGLYRVGEAQYDDEKFDDAAASYLAAHTKVRELADAGALNAAQARELGEKAIHKLGWACYRRELFDKAVTNFNYQLKNYKNGKLQADARFMLSESLFKQENWKDALAAYDQLQNPSTPEFAALADLHAAQAANQLEQFKPAMDRLKGFAEKHPGSEVLPEAMFEQGWSLQNLGKPDEAIALYEQVTGKTGREVAAKARFMIGEIHFEKKDHREAIRHFFKVAFSYGYPAWQANAHFESARCFEVLKKTDQAIKSYNEVVTKHPDSDKAPEARRRLKALGG